MRVASKNDLITVIDKNTEELHRKIDIHRCLMASILEKGGSDEIIARIFLPTGSPDETGLKDAIKETTEILEESRKAFKSKRLETLRKKLTQVLMESR